MTSEPTWYDPSNPASVQEYKDKILRELGYDPNDPAMSVELVRNGTVSAVTATETLLQERGKTHGSFNTNAIISLALKEVIHGYLTDEEPPEHREALDMIAMKIARILSGNSNFKDHWDDIAGYAKLASEACK